MSVDSELEEWQVRLMSHFEGLREQRAFRVDPNPIFALEHGLSEREVQELSSVLHAHIATRQPSCRHTMVWIVYASELGYRYSGDEFWQTFERETPGWSTFGNRYWLRGCYYQFQREFNGAKPSGIWAEQFSIICWPITHAILPKDLQRQFARALYESRRWYSGNILQYPTTLGELIEAWSWNASSRFQNFAQETHLVGQIAAALLLEGDFGSEGLVHPATLQRISEDLERERQGRKWLRDARHSAQRRVNVRGLGPVGGKATVVTSGNVEAARAELRHLGIEPRLVLRPKNAEKSAWSLHLEIPDLSHLLVRFPAARDSLVNSRCTVRGASGRPLARGRLLHGVQRIALQHWPSSNESLLEFESPNQQLDFLLRTECLLRPGPVRLFRVASDGLAYECRSLNVRPGQQYVLLSTTGTIETSEHVRHINVNCHGVDGAEISLPQVLSESWEKRLLSLGLSQARTIEVWSAGLDAITWDGEGHGEWLTSDSPCLAIRADHPIEQLRLMMGQDDELYIDGRSMTLGEPVFVELTGLTDGHHRLRISGRESPELEFEVLGDLEVVVRESSPWADSTRANGLLELSLEPPAPSLEELWDGDVDVSVSGPVGRHAIFRIEFFNDPSTKSIGAYDLGSMELPVTAGEWRERFETRVMQVTSAQRAYDSAKSCEMRVSAGDLGVANTRCERDFTPLRWITRRRAGRYELQLFDDEDGDSQLTVKRLAFERPIVEEEVIHDGAINVSPDGGLYIASKGTFFVAKIMPPIDHSLKSLVFEPVIEEQDRSLTSAIELIQKSHFWRMARLPGDFIALRRRQQILLTLAQHIAYVVCGPSWARAEVATIAEEIDGTQHLRKALSRTAPELEIASLLIQVATQLAGESCLDRAERLASLATTTGLLTSNRGREGFTPLWLSEFALRVASDPGTLESWAGDRLRAGVSRLMEIPALVRAARFVVLVVTPSLDRRHSGGSAPLAGWEWK